MDEFEVGRGTIKWAKIRYSSAGTWTIMASVNGLNPEPVVIDNMSSWCLFPKDTCEALYAQVPGAMYFRSNLLMTAMT